MRKYGMLSIPYFLKIQIFWEGHKIWKIFHLKLLSSVKFFCLLRISELYLEINFFFHLKSSIFFNSFYWVLKKEETIPGGKLFKGRY